MMKDKFTGYLSLVSITTILIAKNLVAFDRIDIDFYFIKVNGVFMSTDLLIIFSVFLTLAVLTNVYRLIRVAKSHQVEKYYSHSGIRAEASELVRREVGKDYGMPKLNGGKVGIKREGIALGRYQDSRGRLSNEIEYMPSFFKHVVALFGFLFTPAWWLLCWSKFISIILGCFAIFVLLIN